MMPDATPTIIALARKYRLDPRAVLAVARGEGGLSNREDDIGDLAGGGSYGPFQLYAQGALPAQYRGKPRQADSWAWSPAGIRKMASVGAARLQGEAAVNTIVRKFERPAKPDASVAAAIGRLGSSTVAPQPGSPTPTPASPPGVDAVAARKQMLLSLLQQRRSGSSDRSPVLQALTSLRQAQRQPTPSVPAPSSLPGQPPANGPELGQGRGGIDDAFYTPLGYSIDEGKRWDKTIANHNDHGHVSFTDSKRARAIMAEALRRGLSVRENPLYDKVDPVHVQGSDHYSTFQDDPKVGRGVDISGDPKKLAAYMRWVYAKAGA